MNSHGLIFQFLQPGRDSDAFAWQMASDEEVYMLIDMLKQSVIFLFKLFEIFLQDFDPGNRTFNLDEGEEGCSDGSSLDI